MPATASAMMLGHVTARTAVPATPAAMQREAVRLPVETVLAVTLVRGLGLRLSAAGYERRQARIAAAFRTRLRHMLLLRPATAIRLRLLTRRIRLLLLIGQSLTRLVGLWLTAAAVGHVSHRMPRRVVVASVITVVAALIAAGGVVTEVRIVLPELFLRCGDQAEIMLCVLKVIFRRHRVARGLGVACQLHVFIGDVVGGPADFHVGTV